MIDDLPVRLLMTFWRLFFFFLRKKKEKEIHSIYVLFDVFSLSEASGGNAPGRGVAGQAPPGSTPGPQGAEAEEDGCGDIPSAAAT